MKVKQEIIEEWLEALNKKFREEDIAPARRPWLAIQEWSTINNLPILIPSEKAKRIFDWFDKNCKQGSQTIGPLYTGIFYFDSAFWPFYIPICYGTVELKPFDSLKTMPGDLKVQLQSNSAKAVEFVALWADCFDYAYGFDDIRGACGFQGEMLRSGNKELTATVTLLIEHQPNPKSIESARMATEMYLKALLSFKSGLTEKGAIKFKHQIEKLIDESLLQLGNHQDLKAIRPMLTALPPIHERYKGKDRTLKEMWCAYITAQFTGATIVRLLTDRDIRSNIRIINKQSESL